MTNGPDPDWYLQEWMDTLGIKAAELSRMTGLLPPQISKLRNAEQRYNRDVVNIISSALRIEPYELLMPPANAMAFRRLRSDIAQIAGINRAT